MTTAIAEPAVASGRPAPRLHGYVARYEGYFETDAAGMRRRHMPSGRVPLIVGFGAPLRTHYPLDPASQPEAHASFVAGLHRSFALTESTGPSLGIQVDLSPVAARMLLGAPMHELTGRVVSLADALGPDGRDFPERLHDAGDWRERFALLDALIERRLSGAAPVPPAVVHALGRIERTHGRATIAPLAEQAGWSRKHLAAQFREQVGLTPKALARVLRFRRATRLLNDGAPRAAVASASGYYDQAHFNRDFAAFAGGTPGDYVARLLPGGAVEG
jgi:AraC-like DNA-binding protein